MPIVTFCAQRSIEEIATGNFIELNCFVAFGYISLLLYIFLRWFHAIRSNVIFMNDYKWFFFSTLISLLFISSYLLKWNCLVVQVQNSLLNLYLFASIISFAKNKNWHFFAQLLLNSSTTATHFSKGMIHGFFLLFICWTEPNEMLCSRWFFFFFSCLDLHNQTLNTASTEQITIFVLLLLFLISTEILFYLFLFSFSDSLFLSLSVGVNHQS